MFYIYIVNKLQIFKKGFFEITLNKWRYLSDYILVFTEYYIIK